MRGGGSSSKLHAPFCEELRALQIQQTSYVYGFSAQMRGVSPERLVLWYYQRLRHIKHSWTPLRAVLVGIIEGQLSENLDGGLSLERIVL
jgi:hypothetical protein